MSAKPDFKRTNDLMLRAIQCESRDRGSPDIGHADDLTSAPAKVQVPAVGAGMKQGSGFASLRITGGAASALPQGAVNAGQSKIVHRGLATSHHRQDVIQVKSARLPKLGKSAVFTAVAGACGDSPTKAGGACHSARTSRR